jgi:hypothetical protein
VDIFHEIAQQHSEKVSIICLRVLPASAACKKEEEEEEEKKKLTEKINTSNLKK